MADKNMILSADAEEKLLKPIDEYVGKIQAQIDELRVDGSDKVRSLKNHIAIAKEDKNLSKEEKDSIIAKDKAALEKAKAVEAANKDKVAKLIADAEGYLKEHYDSEYYSKVVASCETEKAAENESYERVKAKHSRQSMSRHLQNSLIRKRSRTRNMYTRTSSLMHR